jgi:hypothetical protein
MSYNQPKNVFVKKTRTGNRYQVQSEAIFSSFSSSRSNRDVTSFPRKQISQNFIVGTDQRMD